MIFFLILSIFTVINFSSPFVSTVKADWWDTDYSYRKTITIDSNQLPNSLKNFPVLVYIHEDTDLFDNAQHDLDDIVFVSSDNLTQYHHEIDNYTVNANSITAWIWVNLTYVSGMDNGTNTQMNMYYGHPAASNQEDVANTWDSNYTGVYHCNSTTNMMIHDSTGNGNDATMYGNVSNETTTLHFGDTFSFDGTDDYITFPDGTWLRNSSGDYGTHEIWVKANKTNANMQLIQQRDTGALDAGLDQAYTRLTSTAGYRYNGFSDGTSEWYVDSQGSGTATTDWTYICHAMADDDVSLFVNGNITISDTDCYTPGAPVGDKLYNGLGSDHSGNFDYDGYIDEIRISNTRRNNSWINATYNNMVNLSTFITFDGQIQQIDNVVEKVTDFEAATDSTSQITLSWTRSTNGNYTYIERNSVSVWVRGTGTFIYNNTGSTTIDTGLTQSNKYYYLAWAFNESTHIFSSSLGVNNHTGPTNPSNVAVIPTTSKINFTWNTGTRADATVLIRKSGSFPVDIDDGTELYNGTATGYDDTSYTTNSRYKLFSWADDVNLSSIGINAVWGQLNVTCYQENTSTQLHDFTVFVTNNSGTETYEEFSAGNQSVIIDIDNLPTGEDIIVKVNQTGYYSRVYYMDISPNNYYELKTYLPIVNDSYLYRLSVYDQPGEYGTNYPIEDATVDIKRYINSTNGWDSIGIYLTDGDGNIYVYLIPGELYKISISATGYISSISDFIPSINVFEQVFRLQPTSTPDDDVVYDDWWEDITITINMISSGTFGDGSPQMGNITINYADSNSSTVNTQMKLYEQYNDNIFLLNTWNNASTSFNIVNSSINTTRFHYLTLHFNTTGTYNIQQPIIMLIPNVDIYLGVTPFDLDDRIDRIIGDFEIDGQHVPWETIIAVTLPIMLLVLFGPYNTGLGIISCGLSMALVETIIRLYSTNGFSWGITGLGVFIFVTGIIYIFSTKEAGDRL